jgi:fibro-slime domain-containing protein
LSPETWSPGVIRSVASCAAPGTWTWGWTPPNSITNATTFGSWYNDEPAYNITIRGELPLLEDSATGLSEFSSQAFFPLDGVGHGNTPGQAHNFHFTTEAHVSFEYVPGSGQRLTFTGDDDLWIFVNDELAIDLGGVHAPMTMTINFDARAAELGLTAAGSYNMHIFHAERQTATSNFRLTTANIPCFLPVVL